MKTWHNNSGNNCQNPFHQAASNFNHPAANFNHQHYNQRANGPATSQPGVRSAATQPQVSSPPALSPEGAIQSRHHSPLRHLLIAICVVIGTLAHATTVLPLNLAQLSEQAESAFVIKIESTETQTSGSYSFDLIQGTVTEPVFGNVRTSQPITWKQFRFAKDRPMMGMPTYKTGQEYLIFLSGPASRTGFQMPVGLEQGAFNLVRNQRTGTARVRNSSGNAWLTRNLNVEKAASDMAAREARTRGLNATAQRNRAIELKQRLRPTRAGNSLDTIKDAARLFHEQKAQGKKASREYLTTGTVTQNQPVLTQ